MHSSKVKWILENDIFEEGLDPLVKAIEDGNMEYKWVKYIPFSSRLDKEQYDFGWSENKPIVFYGSLNLMKYIQENTIYKPGGFCNFKNFECLTYYKYFDKYLLNRNRIILPLSEVIRQKGLIFELYESKNEEVFVRPNSGSKEFKGKLVGYNHFNLEGLEHRYYYDDENILVVISSPKSIKDEYRFFVSNKEILSGTSYRIDNQVNTQANIPETIYDFTQNVLNDVVWRPDPIFVIDIGVEENDELSVVEINSMSSSGLYNCDPKPIVNKVKEILGDNHE